MIGLGPPAVLGRDPLSQLNEEPEPIVRDANSLALLRGHGPLGQVCRPPVEVGGLDIKNLGLLHPRIPRGAHLVQHGGGEVKVLPLELQGSPAREHLEVRHREEHDFPVSQNKGGDGKSPTLLESDGGGNRG